MERMSELEELRRRTEELEVQVRDLEAQQVGTRHLAEVAEIDAATLRTHRRSDAELLRIMLDLQSKQGRMLRQLVSGQAALLKHCGVTPPDSHTDA